MADRPAVRAEEPEGQFGVVVLEERALVRRGLVAALGTFGHHAIGVASVDEIRDHLLPRATIVLDGSHLERSIGGLAELRETAAASGAVVRILVLAARFDDPVPPGLEFVDRAGGAAGISRAIVSSAADAPLGSERDSHLLLSQIERSVLRLIAHGATAREAGAALGISHRTVENHKRRIFRSAGGDQPGPSRRARHSGRRAHVTGACLVTTLDARPDATSFSRSDDGRRSCLIGARRRCWTMPV